MAKREKDVFEDSYLTRFKRGDTSPEAIEGVLGELHLSKGVKDRRSPTKRRDNKTGRQVYRDTGALPSQQLAGDPFSFMAAGEYLEPQYNPETWASTVENNTRLGRTIRTYARNTLGLGWNIEPTVKITADTEDEVKTEVKRQSDILTRLFSNPNDEMPTTAVFYYAKVDEESTGNGYIEVVRNTLGVVTSVYHVPAISVRKRVQTGEGGDKEVKGFVQIQGNEKCYFKEFGDDGIMSSSTGKYVESIEDLEDDSDLATEIIHFKLYTPMNSWYGAPRYVSAAPAIAGNRFAAIRNVKFFENDAVPRMAVMVNGGRIAQDVMQQIEDFFNGKSKGLDKAHNVLIIQGDAQSTGYDKGNQGPSIDLKPMTVGVTEDASFQTYRDANDEEIRECFGIGQVFFASDSTNRASAATSREITNEQEFEPDRLEKEYLINQKLVPAILNMGRDDVKVRFRFERMKLTDPLDVARLTQTYASLGAITPNEIRCDLGKDPFPADFEFANKPMQVGMAQMTLHQAEAVKKDWENEEAYQKRMGSVQTEIQKKQQQQSQMGMIGAPGGGLGGAPDGGGGVESILGGLGDDLGDGGDGDADEVDKDLVAMGGETPNQFGTIELMKTIDSLSPDKKILAGLLLQTLTSGIGKE